jgi:hypothetical protein
MCCAKVVELYASGCAPIGVEAKGLAKTVCLSLLSI